PVINNADTKSIGALAKEIKSSAEAVRDGNTNDVKLAGATFTITNMGTSGIEYFTPILNLGETGILGVGALSKEVVLEGDSVKQVSRIPLSLTFDHQILDGASAADFLKVLAKYIESISVNSLITNIFNLIKILSTQTMLEVFSCLEPHFQFFRTTQRPLLKK